VTNLKLMWCFLFITAFSGCSGVSFLGANKYSYKGYYVERWFINPEYQKDVPEGTAFYGAAAEKIEHKFTIKYYIADGAYDDVLIPDINMWEVKGGKVDKREGWYIDRFLYEKYGGYKMVRNVGVNRRIPIQSCSDDGWCKTYISSAYVYSDGFKYDLDNVRYIKREDIYKPASLD